jgi:hypothetical protein
MPTARLHVVSPDEIADFLRGPRLQRAFSAIAGLAGADLSVNGLLGESPDSCPPEGFDVLYRGRKHGGVHYASDSGSPGVGHAANALSGFLEHMIDREMAVGDLAGAMITSYEELNLLYRLLPNIATRAHAHEIGELLVEETARTLGCRRVSLLVLDERREHLRVLASRGLPSIVTGTSIPIVGTIVGHALFENDSVLVNRIDEHPLPERPPQGEYETSSFAVVRVPLQAGGEALGVLTATERLEATEFTSRRGVRPAKLPAARSGQSPDDERDPGPGLRG